ncbi:MAG: DnaJ domain-containing protein [Lachnospira sp.]
MTYKEACRILGIMPNEDKSTVRKKYHQLIIKVHPDTIRDKRVEDFIYTAQQINEAYTYLIKHGDFKGDAVSYYDGQNYSDNMGEWDTPQNYYAYESRDIFCFVEDGSGNIIGSKTVARGKYTWDPVKEDFGLFMLSIHKCSEKIISRMDKKRSEIIDLSIRRQYLAELSYLLSQQYLEQSALGRLIKAVECDTEGRQLFSVPAMLELNSSVLSKFALKPGTSLYLSRVKLHKIYLKDEKERELGYVTFPDDRMYYLIIPLLEQRRVKIRVVITEKSSAGNRKLFVDFYNLNMWIRIENTHMTAIWEGINVSIDKLLEAYINVKEERC